MCLPVERANAKASSKENRKIHLASSVTEVSISGDSVLNDSRNYLAKDVKMDLASLTWEQLGVLILNCLRTVVLQADVVLDCGAEEAAGGVEAVQILVDAVKQGVS